MTGLCAARPWGKWYRSDILSMFLFEVMSVTLARAGLTVKSEWNTSTEAELI